MDDREFSNIARLEHRHWWYRSCHQFVVDLLEGEFDGRPFSLLDVGAGTGGLLQRLIGQFPASRFLAVEPNPVATRFLSERNISHVTGSLLNYGLKSRSGEATDLRYQPSWDVILSIDNFYYLETNEKMRMALDYASQHLQENGLFICQTAAIPSFSGSHDEWVHCRRRLVLGDLDDVVDLGAWKIERAHYRYCLLSPLVWLKRKIERIKREKVASDIETNPSWRDGWLYGLMRCEDRLLPSFLKKWMGTSLVFVLRKKS